MIFLCVFLIIIIIIFIIIIFIIVIVIVIIWFVKKKPDHLILFMYSPRVHISGTKESPILPRFRVLSCQTEVGSKFHFAKLIMIKGAQKIKQNNICAGHGIICYEGQQDKHGTAAVILQKSGEFYAFFKLPPGARCENMSFESLVVKVSESV